MKKKYMETKIEIQQSKIYGMQQMQFKEGSVEWYKTTSRSKQKSQQFDLKAKGTRERKQLKKKKVSRVKNNID